ASASCSRCHGLLLPGPSRRQIAAVAAAAAFVARRGGGMSVSRGRQSNGDGDLTVRRHSPSPREEALRLIEERSALRLGAGGLESLVSEQ
ncbi:unnamed protein product, partial [Polarella glacialis]